MKKVWIGGLLGLTAFAGAYAALSNRQPVGNNKVPEPAKPVDLKRYMGRWYEQYRYEASFQKDMEAVSADYSVNEDGSVKVINRGHKNGVNGKLKEITGRAKIVDPSTNAKLKVSFFGPFYADYWVLDHCDNYDWSIVGEPSGRYLWILTRAAYPSAEMLDMLQSKVKAMGYDWSLIRRTKQ